MTKGGYQSRRDPWVCWHASHDHTKYAEAAQHTIHVAVRGPIRPYIYNARTPRRQAEHQHTRCRLQNRLFQDVGPMERWPASCRLQANTRMATMFYRRASPNRRKGKSPADGRLHQTSRTLGWTPNARSLSNGWALCPAWFPKVSLAAQRVIYIAVRAPARP